jgi:predicted DNA-binding protein (MmcQ/YjbR family)
MKLEHIRAFCLSLPGATEQMQWGEHLLFKVGGKMFAILSLEDPALPISLKSAPGEFEEWIEREGVTPAPYLARNRWIQLEQSGAVRPAELQALIRRSYDLVVAKLPKAARARLQACSAAKARARSKASLP